ncbi:DUF5815 family protein [Halorubrum sp. Ib24]|uniref:DUF5815 family protein n=1 Tax=Halorubrum sp. Ib24 TaxID=1383850 RepID=UPI001F52F42C|nr:DUF5815 family protein [Halorubrum sp. Ib24]
MTRTRWRLPCGQTIAPASGLGCASSSATARTTGRDGPAPTERFLPTSSSRSSQANRDYQREMPQFDTPHSARVVLEGVPGAVVAYEPARTRRRYAMTWWPIVPALHEIVVELVVD